MGNIRLEDYNNDMQSANIFSEPQSVVSEKECLVEFEDWLKETTSKGDSLDGYLLAVNSYIMRPLTLAVILENTELIRIAQSNSELGFKPITIIDRSNCPVIRMSSVGRATEDVFHVMMLSELKAMDYVIACDSQEIINLVIPDVNMLPFSYFRQLIINGKHEQITSLSDRTKSQFDLPTLLTVFSVDNLKRLFTAAELERKLSANCMGESWLKVFSDDALAKNVSENFESYISLFGSEESRAMFAEKALLLISSHGYPIPDTAHFKDTVDISPLDPSYRLVAVAELNAHGIKPVFELKNFRNNHLIPTCLNGNELFTLISSAEIITDGKFEAFEQNVIDLLSTTRLKKALKMGIFNSSNIKDALRYSCSIRAIEKTRILLEYSQTLN